MIILHVSLVFVLKSGDTMTGDLTINKSYPILTVNASQETEDATIFLGTPFQNVGAYKCAIIAKGASNWSKSVLHFVLMKLMIIQDLLKMLVYQIQD